MKRHIVIFTAAIILTVYAAAANPAVQSVPAVEVVFVLDTTGSMGGLIEGAKLKIWSIANRIVGGTPAPELKVGLVAYRDRGDDYVTRVFDLSADLDDVYANLMRFQASGGGDTPEHVSRALAGAVDAVSWSDDDRTLKIIFLVGDAPPQTGYNDGYDYKTACASAVRRDIIINTVQCGAMPATAGFWREIAALGEGEYAAIPQEGGVRSIPTPMDGELSRLSAELSATVVAFGDERMKARKREADELEASMPAAAMAERAAYKSTTGRMGAYDLIDALESDEVVLEEIDSSDLPVEMRAMDTAQKREFLRSRKESRERITRRIRELSTERDRYLREKLAETDGGDSFDQRVLGMIRVQARDVGIAY